jgi:hypothetical protein
MSNGDLPVERRQRSTESCCCVPLDEYHVGLPGRQYRLERRQDSRSGLKQSLARQHDIQVDIWLYIESLQDLIQQTAVLRRDTDPDVELRSVLSEMKDNRTEFDCFRSGAENKKETPHSSKREGSYL